MIKILVGGEWIEGVPIEGQEYRKYDTGGGFIQSFWSEPVQNPVIPVLNVTETYEGFSRVGAGNIKTIQQETVCTITANVALPDNVMTIMLVELGTNDEWINAKYRFDAVIKAVL